MQFTAAGIFHALNYLGYPVSINDVCVFIPAGFSCLACLFTAGIAHEAAAKRHKASAFAVTTVIMVGRCRLTVSKPVLKAPMVSALSTIV
jgi:dolichyl-diphosphooligosaccharide--protein glycosyltransferase